MKSAKSIWGAIHGGSQNQLLVVPRKDLKGEDVAKRMAALPPGFAGADIANVCNEAGAAKSSWTVAWTVRYINVYSIYIYILYMVIYAHAIQIYV